MYIHTGNHYFCPITHETNINPTLLNYGSNWYNYVDYSISDYYTSIFSRQNTNNTYGWGYALGNGGFDIYDSIINPTGGYSAGYFGTTNNVSLGYNPYVFGSGYEIIDSITNSNGFGQNTFGQNSSGLGYSYWMGGGYEIVDNVTHPQNSISNYSSNPFSGVQTSSQTVPTQNTISTQSPQATSLQAQYISTKTTPEIKEKPTTVSTTNFTSHISTTEDKRFAKSIADNAENYLGYNEKDGSFHKFSNSSEWCADFVTYVVKESYKNNGRTVPAGFGSWRCETLKQWAINNNKFLQTAGKADKAGIIIQKVKPGDILILRENGASHTGIVKSVNKSTGEFTTIEGNVTAENGIDSVVKNNYTPNNPEISGFIQLV